MPNILAIIPARAGSKGLPGKNLRPLLGHPLLAYAVAAATSSRLVTRVICSTDDEAIADAARRYGAEIPFMRPSELAQDDTPDLPVFQHALAWLEEQEHWRADLAVQLRPTSPVRPMGLVDQAVQMLLDDPHATAVRTVCPAPSNPFKMWQLEAKSGPYMRPLLEVPGIAEPFNAPRQLLPQAWWQTGLMDAVRADTLRAGSMTGARILPLRHEVKWAVDIDRAEDLRVAAEVMALLPTVRPGPAADFTRVRLLVLDVDGTLTPGTMYYNADGEAMKRFDTRDGQGMANARAAGVEVAVITRENSAATAARMQKLKISHYFAGVSDKLPVLYELAARLNVTLAEIAYMGDDLGDVECLRAVREAGGLSGVPMDARPEALELATWVARSKGGEGAVRELCDCLCRMRSPKAKTE